MVSKEAPHGERMIAVTVYLWTNKIAKEPGKIVPKNAWAHGIFSIKSNKSHGIKASRKNKEFKSMEDIGPLIKSALVEQGVTLHVQKRRKKALK